MKLHRNLVDAVIQSLRQIFEENKYADKVIEKVLKQNPKWGGRDRRFIAETTYGMVRWWRLLKEVVEISDTQKENDFWKLFGTWCVLNEIELPYWDELKNINKKKILETHEEKRSIRKIRESIPDWLDDIGIQELGEADWEKEIHSLNQEAKVVLRVNTLKTSIEELQKQFNEVLIETETLDWTSDALVLKERQNIFQRKQFKDGLFEVQDAASQVVASFLRVEPNMRVIDACAGGGGKTLHLAALMKNKGRIIALDVEQWKLDEVKKRARRAGASNIETRLVDSTKVIKRLHESADRLLLDVPCSGSGVLKRNPDAKWKLTAEYIEYVKTKQYEILTNYSSMLKTSGVLVYSTCSIFPSENAKQIEKFIKEQNGKYQLIEEKRLLPSANGFDGFYMAAMKKL